MVGQFDVGTTLVVALGRYKACPYRDIKGEALGWSVSQAAQKRAVPDQPLAIQSTSLIPCHAEPVHFAQGNPLCFQ